MGETLSAEKVELFCLAYLKNFNASDAARAIGYEGKRANQAGYEYLTKPDIQARLKELAAAKVKKAHVSLERTVNEMACVGYADIFEIVNIGSDGSVTLDKDAARRHRRAIAELSYMRADGDSSMEQVKIKMHGKVAALGHLWKYFDLDGRGRDSGKGSGDATARRISELVRKRRDARASKKDGEGQG